MKPKAFISSLATEHSLLRKAIKEDYGDAVWIAEYSAPELKGKIDLEIIDTCTDFIEEANSFICIFAGRRGTRVKIGQRIASATHFETELFHAAVMGKPIYVFVAKGFDPDPSLRGILEILQATVEPKRWEQQLTDKQIRSEIGRILKNKTPRITNCFLKKFVFNLFKARRGIIRRDQPLTEFFAGDTLVNDRMEPDLSLVDSILLSLNEEPDQRKKLSRIYIALREILNRPFNDIEFL